MPRTIAPTKAIARYAVTTLSLPTNVIAVLPVAYACSARPMRNAARLSERPEGKKAAMLSLAVSAGGIVVKQT